MTPSARAMAIPARCPGRKRITCCSQDVPGSRRGADEAGVVGAAAGGAGGGGVGAGGERLVSWARCAAMQAGGAEQEVGQPAVQQPPIEKWLYNFMLEADPQCPAALGDLCNQESPRDDRGCGCGGDAGGGGPQGGAGRGACLQ